MQTPYTITHVQEIPAIKIKCTGCGSSFKITSTVLRRKRRVDNCVLLHGNECAFVQRILIIDGTPILFADRVKTVASSFGTGSCREILRTCFFQIDRQQPSSVTAVTTEQIRDKLAYIQVDSTYEIAVPMPNHVEQASI